jgi:hypothetical protein
LALVASDLAVKPVEASAQQIKPELIAGRPADRAGQEQERPEQLSIDHVGAGLAEIDLSFNDGEEDDDEVGHHESQP